MLSRGCKADARLKLLSRQPGKVDVEFEFVDAEGCPVTHIEPEYSLKASEKEKKKKNEHE